MPNYCNNILEIFGDEAELHRFMSIVYTGDATTPEEMDDNDFSLLDRLYPCPDELVNTPSKWSSDPEEQAKHEQVENANIAKYGYKDWYDWCVANWGTKWGDSETYLSGEEAGYRAFGFQSAWCAPEKAFETISTMFPTLKFILSYYESGCGFAGATAYLNGKKFEAYTEDVSIPEVEDPEENPDYWSDIEDAYMEMAGTCADLVKKKVDNEAV